MDAIDETSLRENLLLSSKHSNGVIAATFTELDASQRSRLTLTTSSSSNSNGKKKFTTDTDDLYYEGNRVYKDDLDSSKSLSNGSVKQRNKIVKVSDYNGLTIERKNKSVSIFCIFSKNFQSRVSKNK